MIPLREATSLYNPVSYSPNLTPEVVPQLHSGGRIARIDLTAVESEHHLREISYRLTFGTVKWCFILLTHSKLVLAIQYFQS